MPFQVLEKFVSNRPRRVLLAVASPIEARAVISGLGGPATLMPPAWQPVQIADFDLLLTGISKSNAAGAVARSLDPGRHGLVLSVGIAGAYPGPDSVPLGASIAASISIMADDGVQTPDQFLDCERLGFPLGSFTGSGIPADPVVLKLLAPITSRVGPIATVSTCSGTDELSTQLRDRTGASAECMEGAAVGLVAHRLGVPFAELRTISNTTGDRSRQVWDIPRALARLSDVVARL